MNQEKEVQLKESKESNKVVFKDDGKWASMIFPNDTKIQILYKHMKDEYFTFHYDLGVVCGVMKVRPQWTENYDDIMSQAECGLSYLFLPMILNYLEEVDQNRLNHYQHVVNLYDKGKLTEIKNLNWIAYHDIDCNPKRIKEIRRFLKLQIRILKVIKKMKIYLAN